MILFFGLLGSGAMLLMRYFELITISYWWCLVPIVFSLIVVLIRQIMRSSGGSSLYDDGGSIYSDIAFWSVVSSSNFDSGSDWGGGDFGGGGDGGFD